MPKPPAVPAVPAAPGGAAPKPPAVPAAPGSAKPASTATPAAASKPETSKPVASKPAATAQPATTAKPVAAKNPTGSKPTNVKPTGAKPTGWRRVAVLGVLGAVALLALAVVASRAFLSSGAGQDFLARFPGENPLPENAPVGLPAWVGWSHFFNMFFMALIVKTGWQVRTQRKPDAYWRPKRGGKKISLTLWIHLMLDVLWIVNGVIFVVLLAATGQWMRVVPTSWEVFPNALSAGLQYLSLDWPTENAWVNYNALQQLAYFVTVFIAAPLAIASGVRMSYWWKNEWKTANKIFSAAVARKIHFPVMIYFLLFVVIHVVLVLATGVLRNLNNMYAARGDVNPDIYADNWLGFIIFAVSLAVIAGAWVATKPAVLAPVARKFGEVTAR